MTCFSGAVAGSINPGWRTPPLNASLVAASSADLDAGCNNVNVNGSSSSTPLPLGPNGMPLRQGQQQVLASLLRVRALAKQSQARLDQQRIHLFLNACSAGQVDKIKLVSTLGGVGTADALEHRMHHGMHHEMHQMKLTGSRVMSGGNTVPGICLGLSFKLSAAC